METIRSLLDDPIFDSILDVIRSGDVSLNKELLLVCRHGGLAEGTGNFAKLTQRIRIRLLEMPIFSPSGRRATIHSENNALNSLTTFFGNPLYCGAVLMSCFLAPLPNEEIQKQILASYMKEIKVMDSDPTDIPIDFTPFFGNYLQPMHTCIPHNPKMARMVHESIDSWKENQSQHLHYPSMSSKLLPTHTREQLRNYVDKLVEPPGLETIASVEYLETFYGIPFEGSCELGQRWQPNGITPRSYFVSGVTAHHHAKYMKGILNGLVDSLVVTEKRTRVTASRIRVSGVKTALFYDLTSFTSNMALQKVFLGQLSVYCRGTRIQVMDPEIGVLDVDLGDLLASYNEMNHQPAYRWKVDNPILEEVHGVAGFLGVYGNIATCNFIHGAVILQCCDDVDECGCAGDDVVVVVEDENTVWMCASLLGILAVEKTFCLWERDVVYLKRRTWLDPITAHLRQGQYFQCPSFLRFSKKDGVISRFRESRLTKSELLDIAASSLMASFRSASHFYKHDWNHGEISSFMTRYYHLQGFPPSGSVPQYYLTKSSENNRFVPALDHLGDPDFINRTLEDLYPGFANIPDRRDVQTYDIPLEEGSLFIHRGSPHVNYLKRMGFLELVGKEHYIVQGEDGLNRLKEEFDRKFRKERSWLRYRVVRKPPFPVFNMRCIPDGSYVTPKVDFRRGEEFSPKDFNHRRPGVPTHADTAEGSFTLIQKGLPLILKDEYSTSRESSVDTDLGYNML